VASPRPDGANGLVVDRMKTSLETQIDLDQAPAQLWAVLTDFPAYADWNPFLTKVHGVAREGERLLVDIKPPGETTGTATNPVIIELRPERTLAWRGGMGPPGLFTFEHRMTIEPLAAGSRFQQTVRFSGMMVSSFAGMIGQIEQGLRDMQQALQARVAI